MDQNFYKTKKSLFQINASNKILESKSNKNNYGFLKNFKQQSCFQHDNDDYDNNNKKKYLLSSKTAY